MDGTMSYYSRYLDGEHEPVWKELIQCGSDVRSEPLRSDANAVAKVFAERGYKNLELLHNRLIDFGYQFDDPKSALVEASPADFGLIDNAEQEIGVLPLAVRAWYERIASVNFCQASTQLFSEAANVDERISVAGLGFNPVLVFLCVPNCLALKQRLIVEEKEEGCDVSDWLKTLLPTGGWASNCNPKGFHLPDARFDGALYDEGFGQVFFVQELRTAFSSGGFPYWQIMFRRKRFSSPLKRNPDFGRLLPMLVADLTLL
jgi:hypothetical protein